MKQKEKSWDEEKNTAIMLMRYVHISIGRLLYSLRLTSHLSYGKLMEDTTVNAGAMWRMENARNCSVLSFMQAFHSYLKSIKCTFNLPNLCRAIACAILSGESLVLLPVKSDQLKNYPAKQRIFVQRSDDEEELKRRHKQQEALLLKNRKQRLTRWEKHNLPQTKKKKKCGKK